MTRTRVWIAGAVVVILTIAGLGWTLGVSPMLAEADAAAQTRSTVETQNTVLAAANEVLREQFENIDELETELAELRTQLPEGPEVESFIDYINEEAIKGGVIVSTIEVVEPSTYGADGEEGAPPAEPTTPPAEGETPAPAAAGQAAAATQIGAMLYSVGITVTVQGSEEQVMAFARGLQDSDRLFFGKSVTFTSGSVSELGGAIRGHLFVLDLMDPEEETAEGEDEATEDE